MGTPMKLLPPHVQRLIAQQEGKADARVNKHHAQRTEYNGVTYASRAEATRAAELDQLVEAGEIEWWIGQPKFRLGCPENVYVADFLVAVYVCFSTACDMHVEDVKGQSLPKFKRDCKLWRQYGPIPLHVKRRKGDGWDTEVIEPKPRTANRRASKGTTENAD